MDDWREQGACFESGDPRFFGIRGAASRGYRDVIDEFCASCPVIDRCLIEGLASVRSEPIGLVWGVWGGLSPARVVVAYQLLRMDPSLTLSDLRELTNEISNPGTYARSPAALAGLF